MAGFHVPHLRPRSFTQAESLPQSGAEAPILPPFFKGDLTPVCLNHGADIVKKS